MKLYYDLHVHSCLSPCADDDMTPADIAGMAKLNGLDVVALTDHNSTLNCPAFFHFAHEYGICPIAGMELTTMEEIHMLCLFPTLDSAMDFDRYLESFKVQLPNHPDIFGKQLIRDTDDEVCGEYPGMLAMATSLDVSAAVAELRRRGAFICPAHADRDSYGMVAVLGTVPSEYGFPCIEFHKQDKAQTLIDRLGISAPHYIFNSDAHTLTAISENINSLTINGDQITAAAVIESISK